MLHADCMEFMRGQPDGAFDLAIVDPPYGIGEDGGKTATRKGSSKAWKNQKMPNYLPKEWDSSPPDDAYFSELLRVSKNQIVWGANHFISRIPIDSPCWIVWRKNGQNPNSDFADAELAWSSFDSAVRNFDFAWSGFGAVNAGEARIHPTQKPVALYKWLLTRYAKPGQKILDTHGGSGSDCIAVHDVNADLVSRGLEPMTLTWMELDGDYYAAAVKRYETHAAQLHLFDPGEPAVPVPLDLDL